MPSSSKERGKLRRGAARWKRERECISLAIWCNKKGKLDDWVRQLPRQVLPPLEPMGIKCPILSRKPLCWLESLHMDWIRKVKTKLGQSYFLPSWSSFLLDLN